MSIKLVEHEAPSVIPSAVRAQMAVMQEAAQQAQDEEARRRGWGRRVTIGDVARFHERRDKCKCHGNVELTAWTIVDGQRVPTMQICPKAMEDIARLCGWRVVNTPQGPRWYLGVEPENFGLWSVFYNSVRSWVLDQQMRKALDEQPGVIGGNGRWSLPLQPSNP